MTTPKLSTTLPRKIKRLIARDGVRPTAAAAGVHPDALYRAQEAPGKLLLETAERLSDLK